MPDTNLNRRSFYDPRYFYGVKNLCDYVSHKIAHVAEDHMIICVLTKSAADDLKKYLASYGYTIIYKKGKKTERRYLKVSFN